MTRRGALIVATFVALLMDLPARTAFARDGSALREVPVRMQGAWGWSLESCRDVRDDGRVLVTARSVAFFASSYILRRIVAAPRGGIRAEAVTREEGEPDYARDRIELRLLGADRLSITTGASGHHDYVRCATRSGAVRPDGPVSETRSRQHGV